MAIFLLLVIAVVAVVAGVALYVTGGAILVRGERRERRPRGQTDPVKENTTRMRPPGESREDS